MDKFYRLSRGYGWWSDEQPSEEIKQYVEQQLKENVIDVVLSHTCPFKYEPVEEFLPGIDQSTVDDSTEKWLDVIEETTDYINLSKFPKAYTPMTSAIAMTAVASAPLSRRLESITAAPC